MENESQNVRIITERKERKDNSEVKRNKGEENRVGPSDCLR